MERGSEFFYVILRIKGRRMLMNIKGWIKKNKRWTLVISLVVVMLFYGLIRSWKTNQGPTRYVTAVVTKATIVDSVSATGQASTLNQVEIKPQSSGMVTAVSVKQGDTVKAGQLIVQLDQRSASVSLAQARANLTAAQATYSSLVTPTQTDLSILEQAVTTAQLDLAKTQTDAENSIVTAQGTVDTAFNNLKFAQGGEDSQIVTQAYQNAVTSLQTASAKLDDLLTQADSILGVDNTFANVLYKSYLSILNNSYLNIAQTDYAIAKDAKQKMQADVMLLKTSSPHATIDAAFPLAEEAFSKMSQLMTDIANVLTATPPVGTLTQSSLDSLKSSISSSRSSVASQSTSIITQEQSLTDAKNSYSSAQLAYDKALRDFNALKTSNDLSVHQKQVALQQAQDNLRLKESPERGDVASAQAQLLSAQAQYQSALNTYDNNNVKAPFDGIVATLSIQKGDQATSATAVATLITSQQIATVTLNEVDVAKIKVGQSATLTFDAVSDLTIAGKVSQVDMIGAVTQGVVTYNVQIYFQTDDPRIKPGMSVSANIITDTRQDVLTVSSQAVKTSNSGDNYVEVLDPAELTPVSGSNTQVTSKTAPRQVTVQTGLSSDTQIEIISGLNEGDTIVSQTISLGTKTTAASTQSSGISIPGITGGGGGGTFRGPGG